MVKKIKPGKWCLYTSDGSRILGCHPTKKACLRQERAVQISKARAAGHHIPRKKV